MTTPTHSPIPYTQITWITETGRRRTAWAREIAGGGKAHRYFKIVNDDGEDRDPSELLVAAPIDIVRERPARQNLKYGTLEVIG